ncbi:MAG: amino acid-binding protein [Bacteroidales bacterium]|nr:amino acid-binding protein [Bacteroidales bacterium]
MIIEQLSIFLNNSIGRLSEVTGVLGTEGINMKAFTLCESSDFGLLRIITDDNEKAVTVLKRHGFAISSSKVVFIDLQDDTPGSLSIIMKRISDLGISVESMYAFSTAEGAKVVIQTDDIERCNKILMK